MNRLRIFTAAAALALVAACGSAPKEQFYALSGSGGPGSLPSADYAVVVGPVFIPDIVDRPQFVLRMPGSEVRIAEQARWAEPLKQAIGRAVAVNVARNLDNARVSSQAQGSVGEPDYRVILDVQRFDSTLGEGATVEVTWTVRRPKNGEQQTGRVTVEEPAGGGSYQELVAAHSRALAGVSRSIAEAIRSAQQRQLAAEAAASR